MPVSSRRRFEVFKRDGFQCQYFGSESSPNDFSGQEVFHRKSSANPIVHQFRNKKRPVPDGKTKIIQMKHDAKVRGKHGDREGK